MLVVHDRVDPAMYTTRPHRISSRFSGPSDESQFWLGLENERCSEWRCVFRATFWWPFESDVRREEHVAVGEGYAPWVLAKLHFIFYFFIMPSSSYIPLPSFLFPLSHLFTFREVPILYEGGTFLSFFIRGSEFSCWLWTIKNRREKLTNLIRRSAFLVNIWQTSMIT